MFSESFETAMRRLYSRKRQTFGDRQLENVTQLAALRPTSFRWRVANVKASE